MQGGGRRHRPTCLGLKVRPTYYSAGLEKAVVDFGAEDSFELASERLSRHHPIKVSASKVREITLRHAKNIENYQVKFDSVGKLSIHGADQLIAQTDGTMLPVVRFKEGSKQGDKRKKRQLEWKEGRLCAAQTQGKNCAIYGFSMDAPEQLGYQWANCVKESGWGLKTKIHVVSDGATWITKQVEQQFGSAATQLIDLYHVMEYLSAAQKANPHWLKPRKRWLSVQKKRLQKSKFSKVISELQPFLELSDSEETPIRDAWRYLSNRKEQLDYKTAIENELPVGSGLIEGGHRHVLQNRLKKSGSWWRFENLKAMAQLRVLRANQKWDSYYAQAA